MLLDWLANTACLGCYQKHYTCSLPITWPKIGQHFSKSNFQVHGCNVSRPPYNKNPRSKRGRAVNVEPSKSTRGEEERPVKWVKTSEGKGKWTVAAQAPAAQLVTLGSMAQVIHAGPGLNQDALYVLFYSAKFIHSILTIYLLYF